jgi:serine/threonine protein phosphatase PrpC
MELLLDVHLITDVGLLRERNEDRCGAFTPEDAATRRERGRLFVVADGMGGHAGGDVAAEITVETLPAGYYQGEWKGAAETLRRAYIAANAAIERRAAAEAGLNGMGAAAVAVAVIGGRAIVAHLGDCRAYLVRDGRTERLTADHTWVGERIAAGQMTADQARVHHYRHVLVRALGAEEQADPSVGEMELRTNDALVLCSDGLSDMVEDEEIAPVAAEGDARTVARALVDLALERGGPDNVSVAVIRVLGPEGVDGAAQGR